MTPEKHARKDVAFFSRVTPPNQTGLFEVILLQLRKIFKYVFVTQRDKVSSTSNACQIDQAHAPALSKRIRVYLLSTSSPLLGGG